MQEKEKATQNQSEQMKTGQRIKKHTWTSKQQNKQVYIFNT